MAFLNIDEFKEIATDRSEVISWNELAQEKVFGIDLIQEKLSDKYGQCFLMTIRDRDGNKQRIWAPARMIDVIEEKKTESKDIFFISLGQKRFNKTKTVNEFDIVFKDSDKVIEDLFKRL